MRRRPTAGGPGRALRGPAPRGRWRRPTRRRTSRPRTPARSIDALEVGRRDTVGGEPGAPVRTGGCDVLVHFQSLLDDAIANDCVRFHRSKEELADGRTNSALTLFEPTSQRRCGGGRRAQRPRLCGLPRRGGTVGHRPRRARRDRRQHHDRRAHPAGMAARLVLDGACCLAIEPVDPRRRAGAPRTLRAAIHRHRPCGGLPARRRRPADGPPRSGRRPPPSSPVTHAPMRTLWSP